jgi:ATP-binding cassette, subfamily B (MDR/TAP), member 1
MTDIAIPEKPDSATHTSEDLPKETRAGSVEKQDLDSSHGNAPAEGEKSSAGFGAYIRIFHYADTLSKFLFAGSLIGAIIAGAALPLMSLIFGQFTNEFSNFSVGDSNRDRFQNAVDDLVLWFVYLFIGRFVIAYCSNLAISTAAVRTTAAIRRAFLEATLRQEVWHFDKADNGSAATQVTTNGNRINQGLADKLAYIAQGLGLFFSAFIIALAVQWKLSLIIMSIVPAIIVSTGGCIAVDAVIEAKITKIYSRAAVMAQEAIGSVKTVHAFWAQDKIVAKYDVFLNDAFKHAKKKSPVYGVLFSTEYFLVLAGTALAFWQGVRMYQSGEIEEVGTVFTVVLSITLGATAMSLIAPQIQSITNASSAASELFTIIDKKSELDPLAPEGEQPATCHGQIEVRNLSFSYPTRPDSQVLHSLNLSIPAGKTTALVGASGCGKSTLVGLLERWYKANSGEILLDGVNITQYNTGWLRSKIRLVQQEPVLFRGTVFQNVAKGFVGDQLGLSQDEQMQLVEEACKSANAHDFIADLPEGYHTQVGERASMLSGGQKQRVAIARSIISKPKILLLDEATSALDPRAERVVQDALDKVSVDKTTLIIAHKLATVKKADNIVVMSYGRVIEQGTHEELIDRDGQYAALVRAQDLGGEKGEADFTKENEDIKLERSFTMARTQSFAGSVVNDAEAQNLARGTLNLSLIKCIAIMFYEQRDLYWFFAISGFGSIIGGVTYPAQAIIFSKIINVFTLPSDEVQDRANFWSLMMFIVALANLFAYFAIGWCCNVIGQTVTRRYRLEMMRRVMGMDADFFDRPENSSGALTSKLSSLPTSLQELISANVMLIFIVLVNLLSSSILAIAFGWKLGLVVVFGGLPFLVGAGFVRIRLEQKLEHETGKNFAESAALATEAVTSIRTVSSLTLETRIMDEYNENLNGIVRRSIRSLIWTMFWYAISQSIEFLIMGLGFWYGSRLLARGEYTTEQFFIIYIAVIFGGQAAGQFFGYSTSLTKARPAANYILWLRTIKAKIAETPENAHLGPDTSAPSPSSSMSEPLASPEKPSATNGTIVLNNVDFRYLQRSASRVLRNLSMTIAPGSFAACVGPSGCGKSTLISLLERFYDPSSGVINLSSTPITTFSPKRYRAYMSLVQQEPTLYQGSVRENIALGLETMPSDEEVTAACRQANALEFIQSLPEGLDTPCGSRGLSFSGGQRQRIAIARALIRKPRLLLLDEATSALDTQSERVVQKALDEAAAEGNRTTVAVAHRLSTIRHADVIFVFGGGQVVEMGTHEELLALKGRYFEMARAQSLDRA